MIEWISAVLAGFGGGVIGSFVIEAYQQRRATEQMGEHEEGLHR